MRSAEYENLKVGDLVRITGKGKNRGKLGKVEIIEKCKDGSILPYIRPLNCKFEYYDNKGWRRKRNKEGLYQFSYRTLELASKADLIIGIEVTHYVFDEVATSLDKI